jgi:lysophospholipase L1-like esterase
MCAEFGLGFVDLNAALQRQVGDEEWIFVDRAHLTDRGYSACAASLAEFTE